MSRALLVASVLAASGCFDFSRFQQPGATSASCGAMPDAKQNLVPPNSAQFQTSHGEWAGPDLTFVDGDAGPSGCFYPRSLRVCGTGVATGTRMSLDYAVDDTASYTFDAWLALPAASTLDVAPAIGFCADGGMQSPGNAAMDVAGWQHLSVGVTGASPCAGQSGAPAITLYLGVGQTTGQLMPTDCFDLNYVSLERSP